MHINVFVYMDGLFVGLPDAILFHSAIPSNPTECTVLAYAIFCHLEFVQNVDGQNYNGIMTT